MAKDLDQQIEDIVGESMVGTTTHDDDKSKQEEHIDLLGHDKRHDNVIPSWENPLKARDMDTVSWLGMHPLGQPTMKNKEYLALGDKVCAALSFQDYYTIKFRS